MKRAERKSLLDSEPDVVYTEEFTDKKIELLAIEPGVVYATKNGGRKLGVLKKNTKATLVGFTERAYKIQGAGDPRRGLRLGVAEGAGVQGQGLRGEPQEGLRAAARGA